MKDILICGAGGFIGSHLAKKLAAEGNYVVGIDLKYPEFSKSACNDFLITDLTSPVGVNAILKYKFDEIYQLAADMGGAGYVFVGSNDADIMQNSAMININIAKCAVSLPKKPKIFYSSSACIYPAHNQTDPNNPNCEESTAYPANPDSEYGWEKLFSERLYTAFHKNKGLDIRIARFHNIFGPEGTWKGGKEKAPAAICRKVAEAESSIEIWGDGEQTRSFLYVDECLEGVARLMASEYREPLNIGSDEMVTINKLANMVIGISKKSINILHIPGPLGVRGRNSDNRLIEQVLGWKPSAKLSSGLEKTYKWILSQTGNK